MTVTRQLLLTAILLAAGALAWAVFSPAGRPWLEAVGWGALSRAPVEAAAPAGRSRGGPVSVITRPAALTPTEDAVVAIGDGRAVRSVALLPEAAGRVEAIRVAPGQPVAAGDVILELDDELARIVHDRSVLMADDARATATRVERLRRTGAASDMQDIAATLALKTAELAEREAAVDLARRTVRAPIAGHVGLIAPEPGDQITTTTEITQIDDRSAILVEFRLPERFAARVKTGDPVQASILSGSGDVREGRVSAIDNRVDAASRSFRLQAEIANDDDSLRSGMAFSIAMRFQGPARIAVDPLALQWNAGGSFLWLVREGRAVQVPVRVIQREAGAILVEGDLREGEPVVVEGVQDLRPGSAVTPAAEAQPTAAALTAPRRAAGSDL